MEYNEAVLTVMTYFGIVTMLAFFFGGIFLFRKANKILDKLDKFFGYGIEQEQKQEVNLRDD